MRASVVQRCETGQRGIEGDEIDGCGGTRLAKDLFVQRHLDVRAAAFAGATAPGAIDQQPPHGDRRDEMATKCARFCHATGLSEASRR